MPFRNLVEVFHLFFNSIRFQMIQVYKSVAQGEAQKVLSFFRGRLLNFLW